VGGGRYVGQKRGGEAVRQVRWRKKGMRGGVRQDGVGWGSVDQSGGGAMGG